MKTAAIQETHWRAGSGILLSAAVATALALSAAVLAVPKAHAATSPAKAATGIVKTGKIYHVYKKGKLLTKSGKVGKTWYAVTSRGKLRAYMKGSWCHYADGGYMSKQDSLDFRAFVRASEIAGKVTKKSDSKAKKRYKVFRWVLRKGYAFHRKWNPKRVSWPAVYAFDHFNSRGGDCHSDAAAFAYLAQAVGYSKAVVCTDGGKTTEDNHAWAMISGAVYDPLFAQVKSFGTYYNSRHGSYEVHPTHVVEICQFEKKHGKPVLPKKIKNEWVKVGSRWTYRLANGKRAVGSVKNKASNPNFKKGAYYVFDAKGRLLSGAGTRVVKVKGESYRIDSTGRAKKGWNSEKTSWFDKTGTMATGVTAIGGKLYLFSSEGMLNVEESARLASLSTRGADYAALRVELKTLGQKVTSHISQRSCDTWEGEAGDNVIYRYKAGFVVTTFKADSGAEYVMGVER